MIFFNWISVQWDDGELFMKVLIVDDHALIREALRAVLKQLKREAVIFDASNGRQAMHIVEEHPDISLILLDINLPDRDGFRYSQARFQTWRSGFHPENYRT